MNTTSEVAEILSKHYESRLKDKDDYVELLKKGYEAHIADLQAEVRRLEAKANQDFVKKLKEHEDRERRVAESKQTLYAHWESDYSAFAIPKGIDLRDTKNVCWYVRWGTLYLTLKDGTKLELEATDGPQLKRPERCTLTDEEGEEDDVEFNSAFDSSDSESESDSHTSDQER